MVVKTETCSFSPEEACEATDIPISDVQASCSQAHAFESDFYWDCVTDLCLTNDTEWIQPDLPSMPSLPATAPPTPPAPPSPPLLPPLAPDTSCRMYQDEELATCSSTGDPHITKLDGQRFDFMGAGIYTLANISHVEPGCSYSLSVQAFQCQSRGRWKVTSCRALQDHHTACPFCWHSSWPSTLQAHERPHGCMCHEQWCCTLRRIHLADKKGAATSLQQSRRCPSRELLFHHHHRRCPPC